MEANGFDLSKGDPLNVMEVDGHLRLMIIEDCWQLRMQVWMFLLILLILIRCILTQLQGRPREINLDKEDLIKGTKGRAAWFQKKE